MTQTAKKSACNVGDPGLIPGLGRCLGKGNSYPLQYSFLENPHWQRSLVGYSPCGHKESDMTEQLSTAYSTQSTIYRQKEKRVSEDEMAGWHHRCNGHELGQTSGDGEGQGGLVCCSPWGCKESDTTVWLNNNNIVLSVCLIIFDKRISRN